MKKYRIGKLVLKNRVFLAPMLEPNDLAFRLLCKKAGCGLTYTGMYNPLTQQKIVLDDKPAMQIFCNSTKGIKEFIKKYDKKVSLWDFNLGCPSTLAEKLGFGSFLHNDLKLIEEILKEIRSSTKKPVTIKIRKSSQTEKIVKIAENYCDAVCVHPRTEKQGYSGEPDLEFALKIKSQTKLPVIYSGNVNKANINSLLEKFDFVMIGREAIGNPSIFAEVLGSKKRVGFSDYLKLVHTGMTSAEASEKYNLPFRQIKYQAMNFTKGMEGAKKMREKLIHVKDIEDIKKVYSFC